MGKYKNIEAVDLIFSLEDLLNRLNKDGVGNDCKVQFMAITLTAKPHQRGFLYKQTVRFALWLLVKVVGFYVVFPDEQTETSTN